MKNDKLRLVLPSLEMRAAAEDFKGEFIDNGEEKINGSCGMTRFAEYKEWLDYLSQMSDQHGRVPSSTYFAFLQPANRIVGIVDIRHYLTEEVRHNGHIGYSVRPSERSKGLGTEILRLATQKALELGVVEVLVSCDKTNMASRRVIRKNGYVKSEEIKEENGNVIFQYAKE